MLLAGEARYLVVVVIGGEVELDEKTEAWLVERLDGPKGSKSSCSSSDFSIFSIIYFSILFCSSVFSSISSCWSTKVSITSPTMGHSHSSPKISWKWFLLFLFIFHL